MAVFSLSTNFQNYLQNIDSDYSIIKDTISRIIDVNDVEIVKNVFDSVLNIILTKAISYKSDFNYKHFKNSVTEETKENNNLEQITYLVFLTLAIRQRRWRIVKRFDSTRIPDDKIRFEIARIITKEDPTSVAPYFHKLQIDSGLHKLIVFLEALNQDLNFDKFLTSYGLGALTAEMQDLLSAILKIKSFQFNKLLNIVLEKFHFLKIHTFLANYPGNQDVSYQKTALWMSLVVANLYLYPELVSKLDFQNTNILNEIENLNCSITKWELTKLLFYRLSDNKQLLLPKNDENPRLTIPLFLASLLPNHEKLSDQILANSKSLKDAEYYLQLIKTLYRCCLDNKIDISIITKILSESKGSQTKLYLAQLKAASLLKIAHKFQNIELTAFPSTLFENLFELIPELSNEPDFTKKYEEKFGKSRLPDLLPLYISDLTTLPEHNKHAALTALSQFIKAVLNDSFLDLRYEISASDHLAYIQNMHPTLLTEFKKGETIDVMSLTNHVDDVDALLKAIPEHYTYAHTYIKLADEGKQAIFQTLIEAGKRKGLSKLEKLELECQKNVIMLLRRQAEGKPYLDLIKKIRQQLPRPVDEIEVIPQSRYEKWLESTVVDSDDPFDLFFCTTEIPGGTCMRIPGDAMRNMALLGYLLHGEVRLLGIKQKGSDKIHARALMFLLLDKETKAPVLFLDPVYPESHSEEVEELLLQFAKRRAKKLDLMLLSKSYTKGTLYPNAIVALGGPGPFNRVDANSTIVEKGRYEIEGCHIIH